MRRRLSQQIVAGIALAFLPACSGSIDVTGASGAGGKSASSTGGNTHAASTGASGATGTSGAGGSGDTCKPYGNSCTSTADCCTGSCAQGTCKAETCSVEGFCSAGPVPPCCVGTCPNVPEAHCTCGQGGSPCSAHADCCTGKCIAGACTTECTRGGQFCSADAACCSGTCTPQGCTCAHDGATCTYDTDCCLGICKGGHCACGHQGAPCNDPTDVPCCAGTCSLVGQSSYQCACQPTSYVCQFDEECCSGHCANGACD